MYGTNGEIKIQNIDNKFFSESDPWYRDVIKQTVKAIRSSGVIVEVNTRGVYKKKTGTTYPSEWVVRMLYDQQVPITLSSDAHHPDDLTREFVPTLSLLSDIGFKHLSLLHRGIWIKIPLDEYGD